MTRSALLDKAKEIVNGDRNREYSGPEKSFELIAEFWNTYLKGVGGAGTPDRLAAVDVANMMALLKIARIITSNYESSDSWVDLAGYAACGSEIALGEEGDDMQC